MWMTRRKLLLSGAALAAVVGVGYDAVHLPPAAPGRKTLSEAEFETVAALGEAMFPPGNPLGVSASDVHIASRVDRLLGDDLDEEIGEIFRYLVRAMNEGTRLSRGRSLADLPLDERRSVVSHWDDNDLAARRAVYDGIRLVMGMAFFNATEVSASIGWQPRCHLGTT